MLLSSATQVTQAGKAAGPAGGAERLAAASARSLAALDGLLAPPSACPGQDDAALPAGAQERAMRCLTNFARRQSGRAQLAAPRKLVRSAGLKAGDILRCDDFDHEACGRRFTHWIDRVGYLVGACRRAAENIAVGTGAGATPRGIFEAWLGSPGHRRNILGPYEDVGVGLQVGTLDGEAEAHVWVQHFGARC